MKKEWIKASDRLPEKSGYYLVVALSSWRGVTCFSVKHGLFNVHDDYDDAQAAVYAVKVVRWMEIPRYVGVQHMGRVDQSNAALLANWALEVFEDE